MLLCKGLLRSHNREMANNDQKWYQLLNPKFLKPPQPALQYVLEKQRQHSIENRGCFARYKVSINRGLF